MKKLVVYSSVNTPFWQNVLRRRVFVGGCVFWHFHTLLACLRSHQCLDAASWGCAVKCVCLSVNPRARCRLSSSQVRSVCVGCCHLSSITPAPACPPHLTAVSCHSLMDAPGPTIAHYSLLLLSARSRRRQGQICFTVAHLSHSACWHLCCRKGESEMCVCARVCVCVRVCVKKRKRLKDRKRQNDREEKEGK